MKWPSPNVFGNAAQWVSALVGILTLCVAVYGVSAVAPYFQNRLLSEQKAELEIAVREKQRALRRLEFNEGCASASRDLLFWLNSRVGLDGYETVEKQRALAEPFANNYSAVIAKIEQTDSIKRLPVQEQEQIKHAWRNAISDRQSLSAPTASPPSVNSHAERADAAVAWYFLNARTISQQLEFACLMARVD